MRVVRLTIDERYLSIRTNRGCRSSDVITCMEEGEGPLVNLKNVISIYLKRRDHYRSVDLDFEGPPEVLGPCKNVKYVTLENFIPTHLELALMKLKPSLPGARYNVKIDSVNGNGIATVLGQLSQEITESLSLYFSLYVYRLRSKFDGVEPIFNAPSLYPQLWCKFKTLELYLWNENRPSADIFQSEYFRYIASRYLLWGAKVYIIHFETQR